MAELQQKLCKVILRDDAVESLSSFIGIDGTNTTMNSGRIQINLKPLEERGIMALDIIRRLQVALAEVKGITLFMQPVQDLTVETKVSRTQYQYSLEEQKRTEFPCVWQAEQFGQEPGRCFAIVRCDDGVVERDCHTDPG